MDDKEEWAKDAVVIAEDVPAEEMLNDLPCERRLNEGYVVPSISTFTKIIAEEAKKHGKAPGRKGIEGGHNEETKKVSVELSELRRIKRVETNPMAKATTSNRIFKLNRKL